MKLFVLAAVALILCSANKNNYAGSAIQNAGDTSFSLRYIFIGFGSNRWDMQPGFTINGTKFTYTSEEVWGISGEKRQIDTLAMGNVRQSSIDSIIAAISNIQDTIINKSNMKVLSGGIADLKVCYNKKEIFFSLFNTGDTAAEKITHILNSYIPNSSQKLIMPWFR